jgi:hypothetical protein
MVKNGPKSKKPRALNAQLLRKLQALESALENNAKIVIPTGSELVNIIGEMAGVVPLNK